MTESTAKRAQVDEFVLNYIDSVPHLEALLLVWRQRPKEWTSETMARALYVSPELAQRILGELAQKDLISFRPGQPEKYAFDPNTARAELLQATDEIYRAELVRISTLIHGKASAAVRDFARAFRFTKDSD